MDAIDKPEKSGRLYSLEPKQAILREFEAWKGSAGAFAASKGMSRCTLYTWRNSMKAHGTEGLKPGFRRGAAKTARHKGPYSPEQRLKAVEAFKKSGMNREAFCKAWKLSPVILRRWLARYDQGGGRALIDGNSGSKRGPKGIPDTVRDRIVELKEANPGFGLRKVRDFLSVK